MTNNRLNEAQEALKHWQEKLNLADWDLSVELTNFDRTDYVQTGDFEITGEKSAVILISQQETNKDIKNVVLHELIHVLLWPMDSFCEENISPESKDQYFELLEKTVEDLSNIYKNK